MSRPRSDQSPSAQRCLFFSFLFPRSLPLVSPCSISPPSVVLHVVAERNTMQSITHLFSIPIGVVDLSAKRASERASSAVHPVAAGVISARSAFHQSARCRCCVVRCEHATGLLAPGARCGGGQLRSAEAAWRAESERARERAEGRERTAKVKSS